MQHQCSFFACNYEMFHLHVHAGDSESGLCTYNYGNWQAVCRMVDGKEIAGGEATMWRQQRGGTLVELLPETSYCFLYWPTCRMKDMAKRPCWCNALIVTMICLMILLALETLVMVCKVTMMAMVSESLKLWMALGMTDGSTPHLMPKAWRQECHNQWSK